jgi:hypothetical protein
MNTQYNDPKGAAGALKTPLGLIPPYAMEQTAWVHKLGAEKYGPFNWRKTGVCASTYVNAIMRHLNAWRDGETVDPESGISHLAHVACSCNILLDAGFCGTLQDDRNITPPNTAVSKMDKPAEDSAPVGAEYRLLEVGEIVQEGDQYYCPFLNCWFFTSLGGSNQKAKTSNVYRRKVGANEPDLCTCGRIKINHFMLGLICEDCEIRWQDPY